MTLLSLMRGGIYAGKMVGSYLVKTKPPEMASIPEPVDMAVRPFGTPS
jgi:hypothetical protein